MPGRGVGGRGVSGTSKLFEGVCGQGQTRALGFSNAAGGVGVVGSATNASGVGVLAENSNAVRLQVVGPQFGGATRSPGSFTVHLNRPMPVAMKVGWFVVN